MNAADLRTLDDKGLLLRRQDLMGEYASLKFRAATDQLENTAALKQVRRALARVNTIIRQREVNAGLAPGGLATSAGKLDADQSAFASFRKALGQTAEG